MKKTENQAIFIPDEYRTDNYLLEDIVASTGVSMVVVDGWYLPNKVDCSLHHLLTDNVLEYEPLNWSDLKIPEFFDMVYDSKEDVAKITSMGKTYATVYFCRGLGTSKRLVDMVIWQDGTYKHIDYYYGKFRYLTEYMDESGTTLKSTYYAIDGSIAIEIYDRAEAAIRLNVPEGKKYEVIGASRIRKVFYETSECKSVTKEQIWGIRPKVKYKKATRSRDVLVYTETDQVLGVKTLVESLPMYNFHIAATTQVSEKLSSLEEFPNVKVYPNISEGNVKELYGLCSIYLDLTAILNEVNLREAIKYDQLIISSSETCSGRRYVEDEYYFEGTGQEICQQVYDKLENIAQGLEEGVNLDDERFLRMLY